MIKKSIVGADEYLYLCDELYEDLTAFPDGKPFMSYIITVSAQLPYTSEAGSSIIEKTPALIYCAKWRNQ